MVPHVICTLGYSSPSNQGVWSGGPLVIAALVLERVKLKKNVVFAIGGIIVTSKISPFKLRIIFNFSHLLRFTKKNERSR